MFYRTNDPVADFLRHDAEQQKRLDRLPKCAECDDPIETEECYEINGELICPYCLDANNKHWVEDYTE